MLAQVNQMRRQIQAQQQAAAQKKARSWAPSCCIHMTCLQCCRQCTGNYQAWQQARRVVAKEDGCSCLPDTSQA